MSWDISSPTSGTGILSIPTIHGGNWESFEDTIAEEHYPFSNALSGRHYQGLTPVVSAGPTSAVSAISNPASGALVWDSTLGAAKLYLNEWTQFDNLPKSEVLVYRNLDYTIPASANSQDNSVPVPFDTEVVDSLSEYSTTTFTYTATADGFYFIVGKLSVSTIGGVSIICFFSVLDSNNVELYKSGNIARYSLSTDECQLMSSTIIGISAGKKVRMCIYHNYTSSIVLEGGQSRSFLKIHRVS